jgi:hypothetical protein
MTLSCEAQFEREHCSESERPTDDEGWAVVVPLAEYRNKETEREDDANWAFWLSAWGED